MAANLLFILVVVPVLAGVAALILRGSAARAFIVAAVSVILTATAISFAVSPPTPIDVESFLGVSLHFLADALGIVVLGVIIAYGYKHKSPLVLIPAIAQVALIVFSAVFMGGGQASHAKSFAVDTLGTAMVLIISIVGSIIAVHAVPYMTKHEEHHPLPGAATPKFFFFFMLFLGAMNGLVLANDLTLFHLFYEVTTLCSFFLIRHDQTEEAQKNSLTALWMNGFGGLFLLIGVLWCKREGAGDFGSIMAMGGSAKLFAPLALVALAAFVKSAQFPFSRWLPGAMVAPTPVSALLHSSTMVKAGVFLALKIAPALTGTWVAYFMGFVGAISFLGGALNCLGQRNAKKVLAYSTISNLGLIIVCAGIGTPVALSAGLALIVFHAVVKALLFLCVGTIEQRIHSRDIEDMRGLVKISPTLAVLTVFGILAMILPPFGMLFGKWAAIETAARHIPVIVMLALGSAATAVYFPRWAGVLLSPSAEPGEPAPAEAFGMRLALWLLAIFTLLMPPFLPAIATIPVGDPVSAMLLGVTAKAGVIDNRVGSFFLYPILFLAVIGVIASWKAMNKAKMQPTPVPYLCGVNVAEEPAFKGPMNQPIKATFENAYLSDIFDEDKIRYWANNGAVLVLICLVGAAL